MTDRPNPREGTDQKESKMRHEEERRQDVSEKYNSSKKRDHETAILVLLPIVQNSSALSRCDIIAKTSPKWSPKTKRETTDMTLENNRRQEKSKKLLGMTSFDANERCRMKQRRRSRTLP